MFSIGKYRHFKQINGLRLLVVVAALLGLTAPVLAQSSSFVPGVYCTFTQGGWGSVPAESNPGSILANNFSNVYSPAGVTVGGGYSMTFTTAKAVEVYLPAGGKADALKTNYTNPSSTTSGVFGGQVLALQLGVDFNDKGVIGDGQSPAFGDLIVYDTNTSLDGMMVRDILAIANTALGGGTLPADYSIRGNVSGTANLNDFVSFLNQGFDNCNPSDWVKQHLQEPGQIISGPPPVS
jgi:hypothetical protein